MIGSSRNSGQRRLSLDRLLAIVVLALLGLAGPAAAQVGQPIKLLPQTTPDYGEVSPPPEGTDPGQPAVPQGFEIAPLEAVGTDYAGTLEPGNGGLGIDMWRGTDRVKVERLLPLLKPTTSPIIADLTRRLVLSNAAAPAGKGSGRNLVPLRAQLLADMGLVEDAVALLRVVPPEQRDPAAARLLAEFSWRAGDPEGGCAAVQEAVARVPVDSFWQQATIFCQLRAGQESEAALALDLLREQDEGDPAFLALADALSGTPDVKVPPLTTVTPLYLAMVQAAGLKLPEIAIHEPPPLMLALIAESPAAPVEQRLAAAETAAAAGVLSSKQLAAVYTAEPADAATLDSALDLPDLGTTPATRAILYQAALHAALPKQRAQFVRKALATDALDANYWARLQLYLPLLAEIPAAPELDWFAADAAHNLYAGGQFPQARAWLPILEQGQAPDRLANFHVLDALAGGAVAAPLDVSAVSPAGSPDRMARVGAVIDALNEPIEGVVPDDMQTALSTAIQPVSMPQKNLNLWLDLGEAAAKGRTGETVLLSLVGLNATGLAAAEAEWLHRVVASLRRVGLEDEARRLAVEAAIANGL